MIPRKPHARGALTLLALASALTFAGGCNRGAHGPAADAPVDEDRTIAHVDGDSIPRGLFEAYLRDNINLMDESPRGDGGPKAAGEAASGSSLSDQVKSRLLDRFLREQALLHEAQAAGFKATPEDLARFAKALDLGPLETLHEGAPITEREYLKRYLEDCYVVKTFLAKAVLKDVTATPEEARAYYDAHMAQFTKADEYHLRVVKVDSLAEAQDVVRQVGKDGTKSFVEVARSISDGVEGEQGKDLGWWSTNRLPEPIAQAVGPLRKGQVSAPVANPDGEFNLFYVEDRTEGGPVPFDKVEASLVKAVLREKRSEALATYLKEFEKRVRIELNEENLGFQYEARTEGAPSPSPSAASNVPPAAGTPSPLVSVPSGGA